MTGKPTQPDRSSPPAHYHAARRDWPAYFDAMRGTPARETLVRALDLFDLDFKAGKVWGEEPIKKLAIDLAAGEGRDVRELLKRGWSVIAIDNADEALSRIEQRTDISETERARLSLVKQSFEELVAAGLGAIVPSGRKPMLINASFALPFCPHEHFEELWKQIVQTLPTGGRFAGQFFGDRDDWATSGRGGHHRFSGSSPPTAADKPSPGTTHVSRARLIELVEPMVIEYLSEEDRESADRTHAPKHWHLFHVVLRKR
ncbi:MAG: class I SAM-dependent methyltransferase [Phycisphaerales bacterium]|nr:class I SAM-dependent methyltransferase [Phycisphaerales bacterium]